jgi:hypothetical protein
VNSEEYKNPVENGQRIQIVVSQKKTYKWPTNIRKTMITNH